MDKNNEILYHAVILVFVFPNVSKMETLGNKISLIRQNKRSNKVVF